MITYANDKIIVFLQKYSDGQPTSGLPVEVTVDFISETLVEIAPGIYSSGDWPLSPGQNDIELAYSVDDRAEAVVVPLMLPTNGTGNVPVGTRSASAAGTMPNVVLAVLVICIYFGVMALFAKRHSVT